MLVSQLCITKLDLTVPQFTVTLKSGNITMLTDEDFSRKTWLVLPKTKCIHIKIKVYSI